MLAKYRPARVSACIFSLIVPVLLLTAQATAEDSWTGKKIMPKAESLDIRSGEEVIGKTKSAVLMVLQVERDWLQVRDHGVEGWIARSDVVLLDNAVEHFTQETTEESPCELGVLPARDRLDASEQD